ncbi:MAG: sugar phosphate isomerase/epimerase family protein [Candidatus Coproplasma sp.]
MKIGISTATLFPQLPSEESAQQIKQLGASVAEIFFSSFYEYRPEFSKALAPLIDGLEINSVHSMPLNFECNLFNASRRVRGDGYYWLDQLARSAQLLKCKNYTFHGFARVGGSRGEDLGFIGETIAQAYNFVAGYGVNLCLENTAHYAYNRPGFFTAVREKCPNIYGVFDIKQARKSGYPYTMYLKELEGAIAYVHITDINADGKLCLPGEGITDFELLFKQLRDCGFDGNVLIENYRRDFEEISELKKSLEFLTELAYKLN